MNAESLLLDVVDNSQVGDARRLAMTLADSAQMSEELRGQVALIVTELATNLVKHAQRGYLLLRGLSDGGVEVLSVDHGPGITNLSNALRDGFSTSGTRGHGLGAVSRIAHVFDVSSTMGKGTVLFARMFADPSHRAHSVLDYGVVNVRLRSEAVSGDSWGVHERNGRSTLLVVDGLGHGQLAADAAQEAVRAFAAHAAESPADIVAEIHAELRKTRGAAGAVAEVIPNEGRVTFAGIGNVSGSVLLLDGKRHNMVSQSGTLGAESRRITPFDYPFPEDSLVVMASDGIGTHWELAQYPGLMRRHPAVIAAVLHRDYNRGRDDATVLIARRAERAG